jgi:peptidoglycan glycosyltransferase
MRGRITGLSVILVLLFALVLGQAWFVQFHRAAGLDNDPGNPRVALAARIYARGEILSSSGIPLAKSIPTNDPDYPWRRSYPLGSLTSDIVGFSSLQYGTYGIEYQYNDALINHAQPPSSVSTLVAPARSADTVWLTLNVALQRVAKRALAGQDGAVVAIDPRNGAVLAMYSNPAYDPSPLTSLSLREQQAAYLRYTCKTVACPHDFEPLNDLAVHETFPPGSTFKVVTTAAIERYDSSLATTSWGPASCLSLVPYGSQLCLQNDGGSKCGGTIVQMLPESCDPGYAWLGFQLGAKTLFDEATQFGYNSVPPLDLPSFEMTDAVFPPIKDYGTMQAPGPYFPELGYSAIGQWDVKSTALQGALVAAGVADGGRVMTPHLLQSITNSQGAVVSRYRPSLWLRALGPAEATQVATLMHDVVLSGTASGVGFLYQDDVAAKTGTAQTGNALNNTDDWMIAFAPATNPVIAVAVVVPYQPISFYGATVAGPIVKCVIEGALALDANLPPAGTSTTCPS